MKQLPTAREIRARISELQEQLRIMEESRDEEFLNKAKGYIGKCYQDGDIYGKIVGVHRANSYETSFNAVHIIDRQDFLSVGTHNVSGHVVEYSAISTKDFNAKMDEVVGKIKSM